MGDERNEPTERTPQGLEVRTPLRDEFLRNLERTARPKRDGPQEVEEAAEQEAEYPEDETNEG